MAKRKKSDTDIGASSPPKASPSTPGLAVRLAVGFAVSWHLFCVLISPLSVRPTSGLVEWLAQGPWVRWYTDPLYLNHGYHFFGPEPPINQLVRWAVYDQTGEAIATGEFPNTEQQWPRLLYHRHMMLADQASLAPAADETQATKLSLRSYARHLLQEHGGIEARVDCVRHALLEPSEVLAGVDPYLPETFLPVDSVIERSVDLDTPLVEPPRETLPSQPTDPEAIP